MHPVSHSVNILHFHQQYASVPVSPYPHQHVLFAFFSLNIDHPNEYEMIPCDFDLHFPVDQWCWAFFQVLLGHLYMEKWLFKSFDHFFLNLFYYYFWLCWVFVSVQGLSLVVASGGHSSSRCAGLSLSRPLLLRSTSSRCTGSVVVAHGPSCSTACGIFPDQGSNPCPLH